MSLPSGTVSVTFDPSGFVMVITIPNTKPISTPSRPAAMATSSGTGRRSNGCVRGVGGAAELAVGDAADGFSATAAAAASCGKSAAAQ